MLTSHLQDAIAACEKAIEDGTPINSACQMLGNLLQSVGRFEEAVLWQSLSLQSQPSAVLAYVQIGQIYSYQEEWQLALAAYEKALNVDSSCAAAHEGIGRVYGSLEQHQEEVKHYYQATLLNPSLATPYNQFFLGNALRDMADTTAAINCYQRAIQLNPGFFEAFHNLGLVYLQQQQWQQAIEVFQQALSLKPDHPASHHGLGKAAELQDLFDQALIHYRQAALLDANSIAILHDLGNVLLKRFFWQEAEQVYRRLVELTPDSSWSHHNLGYALYQQQRWEEAVPWFEQAASLNSNYGWTYYFLGAALNALGRAEAAEIAFRQSIATNPDTIWVYHDLAELLLGQQRWEAAESIAQAAVALDPETPWAHTHLARVRIGQDNPDEAVGYYQQGAALRGWQLCRERDYQFSQDWFTHNLPTWRLHLQPYFNASGLQFLEVGSYEGMSACWLLDTVLTHPSARLTCIDPYYKPVFDTNIEKTGSAHKVKKLIGFSQELLPDLASEAYDVIYLDGCHFADYVREEAKLAWRVLRSGGLMIFDDYEWADPEHPGQDCKFGIDAFLQSIPETFELLHKGYQLIVRKLA